MMQFDRDRSRGVGLVAILGAWCGLGALSVDAATVGEPARVGDSSSLVERREPPLVSAVNGVGITVSDLERSVDFFTEVLTFEKIGVREDAGDGVERLTGVFGVRSRTATLRLGDEVVELTQYLAPEGHAFPTDSRSNDRWFQHIAIVVSDMDRAYARLRAHRVRHASSGPQTLPAWNAKAAGIRAFYFKDPDGHPLEIISFPRGKGDPRWARISDESPERIFLGIDHTAIVVGDTERSLAFYRDILGMTVVGESENFGTEQEHLNNVSGARLRITTLRAGLGIGVELLEYLSPTTGREYPPAFGVNDLVNDHTLVRVSAYDAGEGRLQNNGARWISSGSVDPDGPGVQPVQAFVRDPDGHAVLLRVGTVDAERADAMTGDR